MGEVLNRQDKDFLAQLRQIVSVARQKAYSAVNFAQVEANWLIGQRIVEHEQRGRKRAEYGKYVIKLASEGLVKEFGKGFSERTLRQFRQFYIMFPEGFNSANGVRQISEGALHLLTWSHIQRIMRIENHQAREWYLKETAENMWDFRTLDRNISTLYYERLLSSQIKEPVIKEMEDKTAKFQNEAFAFIKNPTVLEFLGLPGNRGYTESDLEQAIIDDMQKFMLELGRGFAFVERQQLIRTETQDFYIDLVFYNYIIKCFVILELKTEKMTHQDIGQLDMYVRMYDDLRRTEGDNPTIGILLCTETDKTIAKYSVLSDNRRLFASKYLSYLPTEEELASEVERQRALFKL